MATIDSGPDYSDMRMMACEEHPWLEWPHDECAGPGTPWNEAAWAAYGPGQLRDKLRQLVSGFLANDPMISRYVGSKADWLWKSNHSLVMALCDVLASIQADDPRIAEGQP